MPVWTFPIHQSDSGFADGQLNADVHKSHIFGGHVGDYMDSLSEEDEEKYKKHFSKYIAAGSTPRTSRRCTPRPMLLFAPTQHQRPRLRRP